MRLSLFLFILVPTLIITIVIGFLYQSYRSDDKTQYQPKIGNVEERLAVSGIVSDSEHITLSFIQAGTVADIAVHEGDQVEAGSVLATQDTSNLEAELAAAIANATALQATYQEVLEGASQETSAVAQAKIEAAQQQLEDAKRTAAAKVTQARQKLLSTGLQAIADDKDIQAEAPTVSGSYRCTETGTYTIEMYRSSSNSGYSYQTSGLEDGMYTAYTQKPGALGACGLYLHFDENSRYHKSVWSISIPNTKSDEYSNLLANYKLAQEQASSSIATAASTLSLRRHEAALTNAKPRNTTVETAWQKFKQAEAQVQKIRAELNNRQLTSPVAGTVAKHDFQLGAPASERELTLLPDIPYVVTAQIPERYVTKITLEQDARIVFDAATHTTFSAYISDISPLPSIINGVTYYEITLTLDEYPNWLRAGMNADIDIVTRSTSEYLRVPQRFIWYQDTQPYVLREVGNTVATTSITEELRGTDGFSAITDLPKDSILIAP